MDEHGDEEARELFQSVMKMLSATSGVNAHWAARPAVVEPRGWDAKEKELENAATTLTMRSSKATVSLCSRE